MDVVKKYLSLLRYETFINVPVFGAIARKIFFVYDGFGMKTFCFVVLSSFVASLSSYSVQGEILFRPLENECSALPLSYRRLVEA